VNGGTFAEHTPPPGVAMRQQATRSMVHADEQNSSPSHHSPGSMTPLPHPPRMDVVVVLLVVDVVVAHPDPAQASQQLAYAPVHPP
jgi:hypothetical protein